ncbi:PD-(D/E)XK nuclease family protein [Pseudomonas sp. GD04087]|uniref:PDDEXK-like family protein n=1 Tax=unclassified Pseudomonas TaxID=196821 RepID=UPI002447328F|nr:MULTISPECIES: PD-(D/E)XK nuclease family protein [unclassified Pseudomonas]MDH0293479.1 PD-(D/E)XK nuclease family protein [Pseudomonas sp. GD04087]MDH1053057.1 PD-(D/E)XK nuclease family protein [Pseudomonas sp. GD03903]
MDAHELYSFLRDPQLLELIELNKISNNIFDIVKLGENQNSSMLAWCMNPNEGHAQGDALIRDFLESAYAASEGCTYDNKKFFAEWTPGRIRTTSFGAAFVTRELSIKVDDGTANGRLDLFLVDPQNKILIAIENKVKASLNSAQLEKYVVAVRSQLYSRKIFSDYHLAFIVLDKDLESYTEEQLDALGKRWTLMDYQWLELSANRARHNLTRGNQAAQMLAAYCQSVTNWEDPARKEISEIMADLVISHPAVIECLRKLSGTAMDRWVSSTLEGHEGELTLFLAQHKVVCQKLISIKGVSSLLPKLKKAMPLLSVDCIEEGGYWFSIKPPSAQGIEREDHWAIYVDMYRLNKISTTTAQKFNVKLVWVKGAFDPSTCSEAELRNYFESEFKGLKKRATSDKRRLMLAEHVTPTEAIAVAAETIGRLEQGLKEYLKAP